MYFLLVLYEHSVLEFIRCFFLTLHPSQQILSYSHLSPPPPIFLKFKDRVLQISCFFPSLFLSFFLLSFKLFLYFFHINSLSFSFPYNIYQSLCFTSLNSYRNTIVKRYNNLCLPCSVCNLCSHKRLKQVYFVVFMGQLLADMNYSFKKNLFYIGQWIYRYRQTYRQTERQTDIHTDRHTYIKNQRKFQKFISIDLNL